MRKVNRGHAVLGRVCRALCVLQNSRQGSQTRHQRHSGMQVLWWVLPSALWGAAQHPGL